MAHQELLSSCNGFIPQRLPFPIKRLGRSGGRKFSILNLQGYVLKLYPPGTAPIIASTHHRHQHSPCHQATRTSNLLSNTDKLVAHLESYVSRYLWLRTNSCPSHGLTAYLESLLSFPKILEIPSSFTELWNLHLPS